MAKTKVLVVDDEVDVRTLMVIVLEGAGYEVMEMESGVGMLAAMNEFRPNLVVLDVTMPQVDGLMVLDQLKSNKSFRDTPVLMASAQDQKSTMLKAKQLGATDFMVKPWVDGELEWRVKECLEKADKSAA